MEILDVVIPNPVCELRYSKDYELLIAVMLSAQCTDKRVNMVTGVLFDRYRSLEDFDRADISDIEEIIRPCGSYRKKSLYIKDIARKLVESGGMRPDRELLESLSGIGRKSCNVVWVRFTECRRCPWIRILRGLVRGLACAMRGIVCEWWSENLWGFFLEISGYGCISNWFYLGDIIVRV